MPKHLSTAGQGEQRVQPPVLPELPPFPRVALRVLELLSAVECDIRKVSDVLSTDPVFTAELLHMANSALFGLSGRIKTVPQAAIALGTDRLRTLATAVAIRSYVKAPLEKKYFLMWWRHSLATALLTEGLAASCSLRFDGGYTAGILHDMGRLALMITTPKPRYARVVFRQAENPEGEAPLVIEQRWLGTDHCQTGESILRSWKLEQEMVEIAARHHEPQPMAGLSGFVAGACRLASSLGFASLPLPHPDPGAVIASLSESLGERLAVAPDTLRQALTLRMESALK